MKMTEFLIMSSLLMLSVMALRGILGGKLSAKAQYALWLLVLVRLLLPMNLLRSPLSIMQLFTAGSSAPQSQSSAASPPFSPALQPPPPAAQIEAGPIIGQGTRTSQTYQQDAGTIAPTPSPSPLQAALLWIWGVGAVLMGAWFLLCNLRFHRMARERASLLPDAPGRLPVYVVERLHTPCLAGLFRPAIYVTESIAASETELYHSVTHELCHYGHGDHIWAWARILCVSIYWFHPLVWLSALLSKRDCETACDEATIQRLGEQERIAYGNTLLKLAMEQSKYKAQLPIAATLHTGSGQLQQRIRRISQPRQMGRLTFCVMAAACLLLIGCTMTGPVQAAKPGDLIASCITISDQGYTENIEGMQNRYENIEKAALLLNDCVVAPGETFSFNEAIELQGKGDGWEYGNANWEGTHEMVLGAGISQVSTTLYNALLQAGLYITERTPHVASLPYAAPGLEAFVDLNGPDLKFYNDTEEPIRITTEVSKTPDSSPYLTLRVNIYGKLLSGGTKYYLRSVPIFADESVINRVYRDDPSLPMGMERLLVSGSKFVEASVYRDKYQFGMYSPTGSELLYTETYHSNGPEIWRRGTKSPHLLTDMSQEEFETLAHILYESYQYDSSKHICEEAYVHYSRLFSQLELDCGALDFNGSMSCTLGVPMEEFDPAKFYPYAAIIFALDLYAMDRTIASTDYNPNLDPNEDWRHLSRTDVRMYYFDHLDKPIREYGKSEESLLELLKIAVQYH